MGIFREGKDYPLFRVILHGRPPRARAPRIALRAVRARDKLADGSPALFPFRWTPRFLVETGGFAGRKKLFPLAFFFFLAKKGGTVLCAHSNPAQREGTITAILKRPGKCVRIVGRPQGTSPGPRRSFQQRQQNTFWPFRVMTKPRGFHGGLF